MKLPRVTIVTPSLNQGRYLERTIRSVLEQGYPELEYIVIDGGSTDGTVEILRRYDDRLAYWTSEPDRGQSHAINKGIARATGEFVAYINSDDYYLSGAFAAVAAAISQKPSARWVAGASRYVNEDGSTETVLRPVPPSGPRPHWIYTTWYTPQASSFWRRDVFEEFGSFREDLHYVLDTEFGLRIALGGVLPHAIDRELAIRYLHGEAKSADETKFQREFVHVTRDLVRRLPLRERAAYDFVRVLGRLRRAAAR